MKISPKCQTWVKVRFIIEVFRFIFVIFCQMINS